MHMAGADLHHEEHVLAGEGERAIDMEESQASIVDAWVRRNLRQVVWSRRTGA
jgi:hypothetical protein